MKRLDIPFNVTLLDINQQMLGLMRPTTSLDVVQTAGGDLAENGLFSVATFGRVGEASRDTRFSYIDLHTTILHPLLYKRMERMRAFYIEVMAGTAYGLWDEEKKDIVKSNELEGQTGYAFFMSCWPKIQFQRNDSAIRNLNIDLLDKFRQPKYQHASVISKILVMPAGLRDIDVGPTGRFRYGDINTFYRKILNAASTIVHTTDPESPIINRARYGLQLAFNGAYEFIENMLQGKKGFMQGKWGARRVFNGTRNVISTMNPSVKELGSRNAPKYTDTIIGLRQFSRAVLPVAIHALRTGYLSTIFSSGDAKARLVHPTSLEAESVELPHDLFDRYTSVEGLDKLIASYGQVELRHRPIMVGQHYLALIYADDEGNFRIFSDIRELPEGFKREHVRPINLCELLYLSGYRIWNNYAGFVTRYPVTGVGSSYPTTFYVKTTIVGEVRYELDESWHRLGEDHVAVEFPCYQPLTFLDSLVIPPHRLAGISGDFDGDTCSANVVYGDESVKEIIDHLHSKVAWVDPRGWLKASASVLTTDLVLRNMTG